MEKKTNKPLIAGILVYNIIILLLKDTSVESTYVLLICFLLIIFHKVCSVGYIHIEGISQIIIKVIILISACIAALNGIDLGESLYGIIRLITIYIISLGLLQIDEELKIKYLKWIPVLGIFFTFGVFFKDIIFFENWITNSNRFAGPFEYANTMALFYLLGIVISENLEFKYKALIQIFLMGGIFITGSRTAFVIFCGYIIYIFIKNHNKKIIMIFCVLLIAMFGISRVIDFEINFGRFITINLNTSTFQGRLLYWEDAIKILCEYPIGLGYMGYYYIQQVMQTGVYSVRFVHNELLQCMLDYGVLAGVCIVYGIIIKTKNNKVENWKKEIICIICIYSMFDFHLQFWTIILVLLLVLPSGKNKVKLTFSNKIKAVCFVGIFVITIILIEHCIAEKMIQQGCYDKAIELCPLSTEYRVEKLLNAKNLQEAVEYAEDVIDRNRYVSVAYLIKANALAQNGDVEGFLKNRKMVLGLNKYNIQEYEEYFAILLDLYINACQSGDANTMKKCVIAMREIPQIIVSVKKNTSLRAYCINEKPNLIWDENYMEILNVLEGENIKYER